MRPSPRPWALLAALLAPPLAARAQQASQPLLPVIAINRQLWLAFDAQSTAYKEQFPTAVPGHDREQGWTPGFGLGGRVIGSVLGVSNVYASISYQRHGGQIDYIGTVLGTNTPLDGHSGLTTDDVAAELGRGVQLTPNLIVIPVLQVGYHDWHRALATDQIEDYAHTTLGAGLRVDDAFAPRWVASIHFGIAGMIDPHIDIRADGNLSQKLGGSPVYVGGAQLDYAMAGHLHVFAAAAATHFRYGRSAGTPIGGNEVVFEPSSDTTNVTVGLGVAYGF